MHDALAVLGDDGQSGGGVRRLKLERPVRTMAVVVPDVDPKDLLKATAADNQQPVQALGPDGPNQALREGVGVGVGDGRLHRRDQHLGALRPEHVVEPTAELRVTIKDRQDRLHPCSVVDADNLHVALSHALRYVSELLIGHGRPSVGRPAIRLPGVDVGREFIGLGFSSWSERDAGDRLHADLIQAVCSLWEALDGGPETHGRRSDRQGLDEAAATDVDLPRRRVGCWQQGALST